jgi:lambda family phage minor tail protein L
VTVNQEIQKLEPGALIELFELDATILGVAEVTRFHGMPDRNPIWWNGEEYSPWPIQAEGFDLTTDQPPTPKLAVGNINLSITALCLAYDDLVGAKLTRRRTLGKYLDAVNFPGGVNADADPTQEMPQEIWYIERKSGETPEAVEFELASALDFNGVNLPRRKIIASRCMWISIGGYRGPYCGYNGPAVAKADDTPTADLALDRCGGRVSSCKLRFGANNPLPFGGFPAAGLMRT